MHRCKGCLSPSAWWRQARNHEATGTTEGGELFATCNSRRHDRGISFERIVMQNLKAQIARWSDSSNTDGLRPAMQKPLRLRSSLSLTCSASPPIADCTCAKTASSAHPRCSAVAAFQSDETLATRGKPRRSQGALPSRQSFDASPPRSECVGNGPRGSPAHQVIQGRLVHGESLNVVKGLVQMTRRGAGESSGKAERAKLVVMRSRDGDETPRRRRAASLAGNTLRQKSCSSSRDAGGGARTTASHAIAPRPRRRRGASGCFSLASRREHGVSRWGGDQNGALVERHYAALPRMTWSGRRTSRTRRQSTA